MIKLTPQMRILLCVAPVDFRRGIDGLAQTCRAELKCDPLSGALFVFRNRSAKAVKLLVYDSQGFWLAQKRLSSGHFRWWPEGTEAGESARALAVHELEVLLWGGDPLSTKAAPTWRPVRAGG